MCARHVAREPRLCAEVQQGGIGRLGVTGAPSGAAPEPPEPPPAPPKEPFQVTITESGTGNRCPVHACPDQMSSRKKKLYNVILDNNR